MKQGSVHQTRQQNDTIQIFVQYLHVCLPVFLGLPQEHQDQHSEQENDGTWQKQGTDS